MTTTDFKKGQRVRYVPNHAEGVVKSTNDWFVFVIYDNACQVMTTGDEPYTAASTRPEDLIHL